MPIDIDPENNETHALLDFSGDLAGLHILEVGCGEGRLTWRYASHAAHVSAIDPNADKIALANANMPVELREKVDFHACGLEDFIAGPGINEHFELAILSWSL